MIRKMCSLAVFSAMLFSATLSATEGNLLYMKDRTLSLAPMDGIYAMAFSPDSRFLVISGHGFVDQGCTPLPIQVWDLSLGGRIVLENSASLNPSIEFSPDGSLLATVGWTNLRSPEIVIYDTETWLPRHTISSVPEGLHARLSPQFLSDENLLVGTGPSALSVLNLQNGTFAKEYDFTQHRQRGVVPSYSVSPDRQRILVLYKKIVVKDFAINELWEYGVYDLDTKEKLWSLMRDETTYFQPFFLDRETIAVAVNPEGIGNSRMEDWEFHSISSRTHSTVKFNGLVGPSGIDGHPDGNEFAVVVDRHPNSPSVEILDRKTLVARDTLRVDDFASTVRFSPQGDVLAVSTERRPYRCGLPGELEMATVELWSIRSAPEEESIPEEEDTVTSDDEDTPEEDVVTSDEEDTSEEEETTADTTSSSESSPSDDLVDLWDAFFGSSKLSTGVPTATTLNPSYPNPFNSETIISYALPTAADIRLEVFTLNGQRVAVLHEGFQAAGYHQASVDASGLASGVYLYRLTTPEGSFAQKFTLLR